MESIIKYVEAFNPRPMFAQVARDGDWENAIHIDFTSSDKPVLADSVDSTVAGEIFYELSDGRVFFIGMRYSDTLMRISLPKDFLEKFIETLQIVKTKSLVETLANLGKTLNDDQLTFISPTVEYYEVGVEGYWKSLGSKILRHKGDEVLNDAIINEMLENSPHLLQNHKNHIALEFRVSNPEYWFGVQVSKKINDTYVADLKLIVQLANLA